MQNNAVQVTNISKTFEIPHERIDTMKGAFVNLFKKKTYEKFKVLNDISFSVKKGEFFGITGRNGSGKSTLLKIIAGIYKPDKGKVKVDGLISPFLELGIGFNPELSGRDNVYLNGLVLGLSQEEIDSKFKDIIDFAGLERFVDQKLKNYSSGMSVRLAFSVAIHAKRDILLMDEVLAVGDVLFQEKCYRYFRKIKGDRTVLFVSHDTESMKTFCDRVMVLNEGKVYVVDKTERAMAEYGSLLTRYQ